MVLLSFYFAAPGVEDFLQDPKFFPHCCAPNTNEEKIITEIRENISKRVSHFFISRRRKILGKFWLIARLIKHVSRNYSFRY